MYDLFYVSILFVNNFITLSIVKMQKKINTKFSQMTSSGNIIIIIKKQNKICMTAKPVYIC